MTVAQRTARLRTTGTIFIVFGLVAAGLWYRVAAPVDIVDDAVALGYSRGVHRDMAIMMGPLGVTPYTGSSPYTTLTPCARRCRRLATASACARAVNTTPSKSR